MSKREKFLSILVILQTLAIGALIFTVVRIRLFVREELANNLENSLELTQETTDNIPEKIETFANVSAFLVWWDQDEGFESIKDNSEYLYSISPFWYELSATGEIEKFSGAENAEVIKFLKDSDTKIMPSISNEFEREPLASIIADSSKRAAHVEAIYDLVEENDYDGISLNYENLNEEDKDNYTTFVTEVAKKLHADDKLIAVHLHAKTEEPGTWNGPQSQDWEALAAVCDKMKIMAYDYHWSTSEAGAIAPPSWVEEVVQHALELIPKEKIYLGIPLYGYDWIDEEGTDVVYSEACEIANLNNAAVQFDSATSSPHFSYTDTDSESHEVWFENAESVKVKLELAKTYKLGGVDFWRLGGEDASVWDEVGEVSTK
jgi:spore germination protein